VSTPDVTVSAFKGDPKASCVNSEARMKRVSHEELRFLCNAVYWRFLNARIG